jgi:hypothetical protein
LRVFGSGSGGSATAGFRAAVAGLLQRRRQVFCGDDGVLGGGGGFYRRRRKTMWMLTLAMNFVDDVGIDEDLAYSLM